MRSGGMSGLLSSWAASDMVAMGVLSSWVMLFTKSDFISDRCFCLVMMMMVAENRVTMNRMSSAEMPAMGLSDLMR